MALPNATAYVPAALQCHGCGQYICKPCANTPPALSPMHACPSCGGKLAWPGVVPPRGFGLGRQLTAAVAGGQGRRAETYRPATPSNTAAKASFALACVGSMCCVASIVPGAGCFSMMVNGVALGAGLLGMLKAGQAGGGMGLALAGMALGVFNIVVSLILVIVKFGL